MDDPKELRPGNSEDLKRDVAFALNFKARAWFRFKKHIDETPGIVAGYIVDHLKLANWKFFRGPPSKMHSIGGPPPDTTTETKP